MFSETGLYSGVDATDWSWAPLWMDFDNDGLKDFLFQTEFRRGLNDMDYINFISNEEVQQKLRENKSGRTKYGADRKISANKDPQQIL